MEAAERRRSNRAVVEASFAAVGRGDVDGQLEYFTEDAVLELPYAEPPVRLEGRTAIRRRIVPALQTFSFELSITGSYDCTDPDTLILEYTSSGRVTTTGNPYENRYIGIFGLTAGRISFQREYYNPIPGLRALEPRSS